jgi:3-phenylpropionate/trans-cinnamate dioxygenase ferredoxin component
MITACSLSDLPPGEAIRLDTDPPIAVFHTEEGQLFALDDTCSHQQASLSDGWIEDCQVECPLHSSCFDLRTGIPDCGPARKPVRTHKVWVEEGTVLLLESEAEPNLPAMGRR